MRASPLLFAPILAAGCVLTAPGVAVTKSDPAFRPAQLVAQPVAVWPVAAARVDPIALQSVTDGYGSQDAFLDSLGRTISARLVRAGGPSLRSDDVVARFGASEATRPLLDSRRLLGASAETRFARPSPELATLGVHPALQGVRYAVLFPELAVEKQERVTGTGTMGASTVTWARGRLHAAVVDLERGAVVWEGDLAASGMLTGEGMKQIEEGIAVALDDAMGVGPAVQPPGW